jgi:hypothetical protein
MKIPKNMTEKEVLEIIDKVASKLAYKFKFGYHDIEDMKQQGRLFAIQGMDNYDESRPLENFLWTHVRNRLFNYKRDNFERPDKPCFTCPFYDPGCKNSINECEEFEDKQECDLYFGWLTRNSTKKNLMRPIGISEVRGVKEDGMNSSSSPLDQLADKELLNFIDRKIPLNLRQDYLRIKYGTKLPKPRRDAVIESIKSILKENNQDGQER